MEEKLTREKIKRENLRILKIGRYEARWFIHKQVKWRLHEAYSQERKNVHHSTLYLCRHRVPTHIQKVNVFLHRPYYNSVCCVIIHTGYVEVTIGRTRSNDQQK